jgi:hypothetical protein
LFNLHVLGCSLRYIRYDQKHDFWGFAMTCCCDGEKYNDFAWFILVLLRNLAVLIANIAYSTSYKAQLETR